MDTRQLEYLALQIIFMARTQKGGILRIPLLRKDFTGDHFVECRLFLEKVYAAAKESGLLQQPGTLWSFANMLRKPLEKANRPWIDEWTKAGSPLDDTWTFSGFAELDKWPLRSSFESIMVTKEELQKAYKTINEQALLRVSATGTIVHQEEINRDNTEMYDPVPVDETLFPKEPSRERVAA